MLPSGLFASEAWPAGMESRRAGARHFALTRAGRQSVVARRPDFG